MEEFLDFLKKLCIFNKIQKIEKRLQKNLNLKFILSIMYQAAFFIYTSFLFFENVKYYVRARIFMDKFNFKVKMLISFLFL